jgi:hypothetical protein
MTNFKAGDRVAYSRTFLRDIMRDIMPHAGSGLYNADRRGEFVRYEATMSNYARVRWDDFEANSSDLADRYGLDYVADARENGQLVYAGNIMYARFKGERK